MGLPRLPLFVCLLLILCSFTLAGTPAGAASVEVLWRLQGDESLEQGKERIQEQARRKALLQEALGILPGPLNEARQAVLDEQLAQLAPMLVLGVTESGLSETVDGLVSRFDVALDTQALRTVLQQLGVFFTVATELPYRLALQIPAGEASQPEQPGQAPPQEGDERQQVARLELLSGLKQAEVPLPLLTLSAKGRVWQGSIEAENGRYEAGGADLPTLWFTLWSWYFTVHGPSAPSEGGSAAGAFGAELEVSGFKSPQEAHDFEQVLRGLQPALTAFTLKGLSMRAGGVGGTWNLQLRDEVTLRGRLDALAAERGLEYRLTLSGSAQSPNPGEQASPPAAAPLIMPVLPGSGQAPSEPVFLPPADPSQYPLFSNPPLPEETTPLPAPAPAQGQ